MEKSLNIQNPKNNDSERKPQVKLENILME